MQRFWTKWTAEYAFRLGVAVFVLLELLVIARTHLVHWDEAVFLTMGKFLVNGGNAGFWEHIRPPGLPLLVAAAMPTGMPVFITKLVLIATAAIAGVLLYRLLVPHVRPAIASGAALLFLFSQLWFAYANLVLTDVFSASLAVIAAWLYARSRFFAAGVVAAAAFLVRFPAGLLFAGLLVVQLLLLYRKKQSFNQTALLVAGFCVPVALWMVANMLAWHDDVSLVHAALRPLLDGFSTAAVENEGLYHTQFGFYLSYLLQRLPLLFIGLLGLRWLPRTPAGTPLVVAALLGLVFFEWLPNDQLRFLILLLPGFVLLAAWGAQVAADSLRHRASIVTFLFILSIAFALVDDVGLVVVERFDSAATTAYHNYLVTHPVEGFVLVTDPVAAWHIPNKVVPVYYGLFSYADAFIPAADAVMVEPEHVCTAAACTENWALLDASYTLVYDDGRRVYVRNDLLG